MEKIRYYWNELKKRPVAYNFVVVGMILLVLAITAHIFMQVGTRHGARRVVPDFSGMPFEEARHEAKKHDLKLVINDSLYIPAYDGGIVLDQLPEKEVQVKPGRTIYITINSFKQKMVPVPYVAGRSLRQAKNMLEVAGLEINKLVYQPDIATNYVLSQYTNGKQVSPHSKIEAEAGSGVTLYVGVAGGSGTTIIPRLIGLTAQQAKSRLWELGLNVGKVSFDSGVNLLTQKDALIYAQQPGQEQRVALGTPVNILLTLNTSKADELRSKAEKEAKKLIEQRMQLERDEADSLARLPQAVEPEEGATQPDQDGFF